MKTIVRILFVFALSSIALQACVMDREYAYYLRNNADYSIMALKLPESWSLEIDSYSDTTLPTEVNYHSWSPAEKGRTVANVWPQSVDLLYFLEHRHIDTICVFVLKTEVLEQCSWDSIRSSYLVLQRYDLSYEDVANFYHEICFPPSEAMKHIHMWPPYGTYDANGNIIDGRKVSRKTP